ncbi:MAG: metallophosphoesterase family protein [Candidatus Nanohaloarchaea archaeon]|nr:metallophosphoesterase family protein [Candidatus Nanohaloarchaea archaeon]
MKILTAGDFHGSEELKQGVVDELEERDYDLLLMIGDYGSEEFYEDLVGSVNTPYLATTGNWDFGFEPPENNELDKLFNYQKVEFKGYSFLLLGSVYPDDFMEQAKEFFEGVPNEKRVVASHYPPHMLGDLADNGNRAGFEEFRELIMREKPALWTCGHIHEDFGRFSLMDTTVLNTAGEQSGKGWRVELGEEGVEEAEEVELL